MKTSSSESFHSTTSQPSPISGTISGIISGTLSGTISGSPPPPDTISHVKDKQLGVPLTTTLTIHNVGQLNNQCQALGLNAHYEVDGDQQTGFGGFLRLGSQTITMDERWPTKKAAREGLAKNGLAVVRDLKRRKAEDERSVENWIGLLNSFHQISGPMEDSAGPIFTEYSVGTLFACTCLISLHPTPFGSESVVFTSKKAARMNAAREAMEFLISFGYATSDGKLGPNLKPEKSSTPAVSKRSKTGTKSGVSVDAIALVLNNIDAPFTQKVNELCPLLGFSLPQYRLEVSGSSLYSGSAYFADEPLLRGPIGKVENIFGKKNAKEESARGVWKVLIAEATQRGVIGRTIGEEQHFV